MAADCEMRKLGSVGGAIHNYAVATWKDALHCREDVGLEPLLAWLDFR
jgi:hypothetical protein